MRTLPETIWQRLFFMADSAANSGSLTAMLLLGIRLAEAHKCDLLRFTRVNIAIWRAAGAK